MLNITNLSALILKDVSLTVETGTTLAIMGKSGCGKTTLLRCIAGLQNYTGTIVFNDKSLDGLPPALRNIGYVEQHNTLLPHMNVLQNVALPLQLRKVPKQDALQQAEKLLSEFDLAHLATAMPATLSGGEQQRIQLARALIYKPQLLLLDEPFRSLDAYTREEIMQWLKPLLQGRGVTTLLVTHDQREASALADSVFSHNFVG